MTAVRFVVVLVLLAACHDADWLQYRWNDRRIVCSQPFDDLTHDPDWNSIQHQLQLADRIDSVAFVHAHVPGVSVSTAAIERVLDAADSNGLVYVPFPDLVPGPSRAAVALSFDDQAITEWMSIRDLLKSHHARVTFFVTRLRQFSKEDLANLAILAADGHAIEAHSVSHLEVAAYVSKSGAKKYLDDEARPSITELRALGYPVTSYAYPFGTHDNAVDAELLKDVRMLRVGTGTCPY